MKTAELEDVRRKAARTYALWLDGGSIWTAASEQFATLADWAAGVRPRESHWVSVTDYIDGRFCGGSQDARQLWRSMTTAEAVALARADEQAKGLDVHLTVTRNGKAVLVTDAGRFNAGDEVPHLGHLWPITDVGRPYSVGPWKMQYFYIQTDECGRPLARVAEDLDAETATEAYLRAERGDQSVGEDPSSDAWLVSMIHRDAADRLAARYPDAVKTATERDRETTARVNQLYAVMTPGEIAAHESFVRELLR
jgi:hypothetical protein